jgi:hypothetical protein
MIVNKKNGEKVKAMQMAKSFKIFRLLRVARIFRVMRLQRILNMTKYAFIMRHHARHLIINLTVVLLLAHWCTCAFDGVGTIGCVAHGDEDEECTNSSWISVVGYEVRTAKRPSSYHHTVRLFKPCAVNMSAQGAPIGRKYVAALYWTFMTLTTIGFGDIAPQSGLEQLVAIIVMIIGTGTTAFGVSHVVQMTNEMSADS